MPDGATTDKKVVLAPVSGIYVHWCSAGVEIAHLKSKAEWAAHSHIKACAELQNASCTAGRPRIVAAEFKHRGRAEMTESTAKTQPWRYPLVGKDIHSGGGCNEERGITAGNQVDAQVDVFIGIHRDWHLERERQQCTAAGPESPAVACSKGQATPGPELGIERSKADHALVADKGAPDHAGYFLLLLDSGAGRE